MLPRLEYIKQARVRIGVTQRRLAALSGISTSMINQIESGRCKPSYDTAKRIFEVLGSLEGQSSVRAGDICSRNLIHVSKSDSLNKAIELMRRNSVSQVPVFDTTRPVGIVSEDGLLRYMVERSGKDLKTLGVEKVMEPPPPIVDLSTPAKAIVPLVRHSKCVLVSQRGNVMGIITVADTLKMVE